MAENDRDEGVIKYDCSFFTPSPPLSKDEYRKLEKWRETLHELGYIGEYLPEKLGYGNLSERCPPPQTAQFIITGTQTGGLPQLTGEHYTRVVHVELEKLKVVVEGPCQASSESLTHAAFYQVNSQIQAVMHIHSGFLWEMMLQHHYPSTPADVPYGTLEMAQSIKEVVGDKTQGLLAMAGHHEGIIAYGAHVDEAGKLLLDLQKRFEVAL